LTAIRFAVAGEWEKTILAVITAAILDGLDGAVARLLKATSDFGAELDSLSDFVSFGVAPAFILYLWAMQYAGAIGWLATLFLAIAAALRLARFNTQYDDGRLAVSYFTGIPSPAGALLSLMPLIAGLQLAQFGLALDLSQSFLSFLIGGWVLLVAGGMISPLPTYSLKGIRVEKRMAVPFLALIGLITASLVVEPWLTLLCLGAIYVISLPVGLIRIESRGEQ
jgi:CDP-diacylglycerol--serine O-phosphatidyltransferase